MIGHSRQTIASGLNRKRRELSSLLARDKEIDGLYESIYEDNLAGKISDERFQRMSRRYEDEQQGLLERVKEIRVELAKADSQSMTTDMFIATVRKYTRARKLTPRMLTELIEYIEVQHAEKIDGIHVQKIRIHYNCVGSIEIPEMLPEPEVLTDAKGCGYQLFGGTEGYVRTNKNRVGYNMFKCYMTTRYGASGDTAFTRKTPFYRGFGNQRAVFIFKN